MLCVIAESGPLLCCVTQVVVGLSRSADCKAALDLLSSSVSQMEGGEVTHNEQGILHARLGRYMSR